MNGTTVERPLTEKHKTFAELMEDVKNLEPAQQEKLSLWVQGYVAAAGLSNKKKSVAD